MSEFSRIAGLCRTIEYGYPDAVGCLARDRELLQQFKSDPQHGTDARSNYRQSKRLVADWHRELAELGELVFRHLPDVAARLRIISPVTGTVQGTPGDVDALVGELRTIQAAAAAADNTVPPAVPPDELLNELTGLEQRIVSYLWSRPKVKRTAFVKAIWRDKANTAEAEGKAIRRLQTKLYRLRSKNELRRYSNIKVSCCRGFVTFDKPDK